jgi:hypothetical protein
MKKFFQTLFFIFSFIAVLAFGGANAVLADVGEAPMPGGAITTGDSVEDVEMAAEEVVFDIKNPSGGCPFEFYEDNCWFAEVEAEFIMENTSGTDRSVEVFYPFPSMYQIWGDYDIPGDHSNDFSVSINGEDTPFEKDAFDYEYDSDMFVELDKLPSLVFPVEFEANSETTITINYKTRLVFEPKSHFGTFIYIMETGSNWDNAIGEGTIRFVFPEPPVKSMFDNFNEDFEIEGKSVVWEFENLNPTQEDNIKMTFSPTLLKIWGNRTDELETVEAEELSKAQWDKFIANFPDVIPSGYEQNPGSFPRTSSAGFLIDTNLPGQQGDYYMNRGWFAPTEDLSSKTIKYQFDAVYEFEGLDLFSGIPVYLYDTSANDEALMFDLFDRPATLRLTFSDGSSQEFTVEDNPDEVVSVELEESVETSSIEIELLDTHESRTGDSEFVAMARLLPEVGDKVAEKESQESEESSEDAGATQDKDEAEEIESAVKTLTESITSNLVILLLVGLACLVGVVLLIVLVIVFVRKRKKNKSKDESKTAGDNKATVKTEDKK